jgi:hypothetical protein
MPIAYTYDWAIYFLASYFCNSFVIDPLVVMVKILLYPWALKSMVSKNITPIVYLIFFLIDSADIQIFYRI